MSNLPVSRRRLALVSTALGVLFLATACFMYLRYASDPSNLHLHERLQHVQALNMLWSVGIYGSMLLFVASLFGLGWGRWVGLAVNAAALVCALMIAGAMCGRYGCY